MNVKRVQKRLTENTGQALIEFILVLPMVFLLIVNLVNFGGFFYSWITVANAARAGANYAILGGASVGDPATASGSDVATLITKDTASLPNSASISVKACQNNVTWTSPVALPGSTCPSSMPLDPEASSVITVVDVTYTYKPFIPVFSFPNLGVYLTLPPTTVYQRASMRTIQ